MCAHVTQRGMTKEGDKARKQRGLVARESGNSENVEGSRKRGGAGDENSIRKIGKNERKVRMAYAIPKN